MIVGRRGFALLVVIWLAALLAGAGLHWSLRSRQHLAALGNQIDRIEMTAAAEAGLSLVRATLDHRLRVQQGLVDLDIDAWRTTRPLDFSGSVSEQADLRWRATVDDLGRRVNLNLADPIQLRRLLAWFAIDSRLAARVADATVDWRDPDDWPRVEGAEREAYLAAGAARIPANGPFETVREWASVMGVTEQLYERASRYLCVDGSGRINLSTAPDPVVLSLPGFGPEALAVLRGPGVVRSLTELAGSLPAGARATLEPHLAWLESRTTFITEELQIDVVGYRRIDGFETRLRAVLVRSGGTSTLVGVREQS